MIDFCGLAFAAEFNSENQVYIRAQVYIRLCELCMICPRCLQPLDVDKEGDGRIPEIERLFQSIIGLEASNSIRARAFVGE
jgi:hypothetical protein